jgi:hypothetical protein
MRCRGLMFGIVLLAVGGWFSILAAPSHAIGYYNLPGNCCQWWGYGYGPGYHAPMVLGPVTHDGSWHDRVIRLPYAPQPQCRGYGCVGWNDGESTLEGASPTPAVQRPVEPTPAALRPRILQ